MAETPAAALQRTLEADLATLTAGDPHALDEAIARHVPALARLAPMPRDTVLRWLARTAQRGLRALQSQVAEMQREQAPRRQPNGHMNEEWESKLSHDRFGQVREGDPGNFSEIVLNEWPGAFGYDEFSAELRVTGASPVASPEDGQVVDEHVAALRHLLARERGILFGKDAAWEGLALASRSNVINPPRDYLGKLRWDGTPRLDRLWIDYFGATPQGEDQRERTEQECYLEAISRAWCVSAVARIMTPGCKADHMVVLEGAQGIRKSTALRALATGTLEATPLSWFLDQMPSLDREGQLAIQGRWIVEVSELDALERADVTRIKTFASQQTDRFRAPYGRATVDRLRQCVFVGTANRDDYLRDETGGRRFWPVRCSAAIRVEAILKDRDQLWAEAAHRFAAGEPHHLSGQHEGTAKEEQAARQKHDAWESVVMKYVSESAFAEKEGIGLADILREPLKLEIGKFGQGEQTRVARILLSAGWKRKQVRVTDQPTGGSRREWRYFPVTGPTRHPLP